MASANLPLKLTLVGLIKSWPQSSQIGIIDFRITFHSTLAKLKPLSHSRPPKNHKESLAKAVFVGTVDVNLAVCVSLRYRLHLELFWNADPEAASENLASDICRTKEVNMVQFYCVTSMLDDILWHFGLLPESSKQEVLRTITSSICIKTPRKLLKVFYYCMENHPMFFGALSPYDISRIIVFALDLCESNPRKTVKIVQTVLEIQTIDIATNADEILLENIHLQTLGEDLIRSLVQFPNLRIKLSNRNWPKSITSVIHDKLSVLDIIPTLWMKDFVEVVEYNRCLEGYARLYYLYEIRHVTRAGLRRFHANIELFRIAYFRDILRTTNFGPITKCFQWYEKYFTILLALWKAFPGHFIYHHILNPAIIDYVASISN